MADDQRIPYESLSDNDKISIVEQLVREPWCPFSPEVTKSWTKEKKLDVFEKLIEADALPGIRPPQEEKDPQHRKTFKEQVEEKLRELPESARLRLEEIMQQYPNASFEELPIEILWEVKDILRTLHETAYQEEINSSETYETTQDSYMNYQALYSTVGIDTETHTDVRISQKDRQRGLYIVGTTGSGKSTLLANLILSDINQGLGVGLIEPHGQLIDSILGAIPEPRLKDVVFLDVTDSDNPFGLNLFQCEPLTTQQMSYTANFVYHMTIG